MSDARKTSDGKERRGWGQQAAAGAISLLTHILLIGVLASVVWVVAEEQEPEAIVQLQPARPVDGAAGAGSEGGQEAGGAPSLDRPSPETLSEATAAPLPSLPVPAAVGAPAASEAALNSLDPALSDPAFAVLAELAEAPAAERVTGRGANPLLEGTSPGFRELVGGIGGKGLDVVIVLDATESMGPYLEQAKRRIHDVIGVITGILTVDGKPPENVRFGAVAYKDYGDDFGVGAARALPLTGDFDEVRRFIDQIFVSGGGDEPEPVHEALAVATDRRMGWRRRTKNVIVLVGDAPVHPSGRQAAIAAARTFVRRFGGTVSAIDVGGGRQAVLADFGNIALAGDGSAFRLGDEDAFWEYLIVSVFGERFARDVEQIVKRYAQEQHGP